MIVEIRFSKFDLPKLKSLGEQSRTTINKNHPENAILSPLMQMLDAALEKANRAIGSTEKESLTDEVVLKDAYRDDNLGGLADHCKAGTKRHRSPEYMQACQRLTAIFVQHGRSLIRAPYAEQSALMDALFADLKTPQATADCATANATEWLQEVIDDEEDFKEVYLKRNEEAADKDVPTDAEAYKDLRNAITSLYAVINGLYLSKQIEGLEATVKVINETVDRVGG